MKTKRGVELNLRESEFTFNYMGLSFFFSSQFYLDKFANNVQNYILEESAKLKNKYNMNFNFDLFLMVSFYKKVEKRGFRILKQNTTNEIFPNDLFLCNIF